MQRGSFILSFLTILVLIMDFGVTKSPTVREHLDTFYSIALFLGALSIILRYVLSKRKFSIKVRVFDGLLLVLLILVGLIQLGFLLEQYPFLEYINNMGWIFLAIFLYFIREASAHKLEIKSDYLNPAQVFIGSFLIIIFAGTLLLMLPNATHDGISALDALFTSTSAVCVTGLIVVDTGSYFTNFGQTIILVLIQLGGLGIMTFASYFSYFFRGKTSYENQLMLKDMTNSEKIGEVFSVLKRIIVVTFAIEFIGAVLIFFSIKEEAIASIGERIFFAIFHTVSGFCNAGFSTLENSLYEAEFQFNYPLQLIVAFIFILGGIGFPILFNLYKYFIYFIKFQFLKLSSPDRNTYKPWVLSLNSRIVLMTTLILLVIGSTVFYFFEYNNTLAAHSGFGKIVTAFFGGATPRTAGFNSVDTSALNFSTIMMVFLLMWIGASPASTGGGIKTSTFALATLNFFSLARGKDRIEVYRREISDISIRRAFAIISLSLLVIGMAIFLIASFNSEMDLLSIAFECFSAYSTVGLSLGITADLSAASKVVIIFTMFIGRVSMLTILIAILRRVKHLNYRYPGEEILMN